MRPPPERDKKEEAEPSVTPKKRPKLYKYEVLDFPSFTNAIQSWRDY